MSLPFHNIRLCESITSRDRCHLCPPAIADCKFGECRCSPKSRRLERNCRQSGMCQIRSWHEISISTYWIQMKSIRIAVPETLIQTTDFQRFCSDGQNYTIDITCSGDLRGKARAGSLVVPIATNPTRNSFASSLKKARSDPLPVRLPLTTFAAKPKDAAASMKFCKAAPMAIHCSCEGMSSQSTIRAMTETRHGPAIARSRAIASCLSSAVSSASTTAEANASASAGRLSSVI